jgi:hypothetical protein
MRHVAATVTDNLNLDMSKPVDGCLLGKQLSRRRLFHCPLDRRFELLFIPDQSNPTTATAINGFNHDRVSSLDSKFAYILYMTCGILQSRRNWDIA